MINVTYDERYSVPIDKLVDFQGDVKTISQMNLDKLKSSILQHGFYVPLFVWQKTPKSQIYIIDGHQRYKALKQFQEEGERIPPIPVEFIKAKSRKDAAEKLLGIASQYGDVNLENLRDFAMALQIELPALDIRLAAGEVDIEPLGIDIDEFFTDIPREPQPPKVVTCPECGHQFEK